MWIRIWICAFRPTTFWVRGRYVRYWRGVHCPTKDILGPGPLCPPPVPVIWGLAWCGRTFRAQAQNVLGLTA